MLHKPMMLISFDFDFQPFLLFLMLMICLIFDFIIALENNSTAKCHYIEYPKIVEKINDVSVTDFNFNKDSCF